MLFNARRDFLYDPTIFGKGNVQTALKINRESTVKFSPQPYPKFFEVNRSVGNIDSLWHFPLSDRTRFNREIDMPCIVSFGRPDWRLTKLGLRPQRQDKFTLSHLVMKALDYFPERGDFVYFNGYRYEIVNIVIEPQAYLGQTNVWTGLVAECVIPPDGDARPVVNPGRAVPSELRQTSPLPEA